MAIHRRLDSFSLIFYLLLILWVKTELHQSLPPITSGFQLLRSLSANKYFCWTSRAVETLYLSWFFLVDPIISLAPVPATAIFKSLNSLIFLTLYFSLFIKLSVPLSEVPQTSSQAGARLVPEVTLQCASICIGDRDITRLHRNQFLVSFKIVIFRQNFRSY